MSWGLGGSGAQPASTRSNSRTRDIVRNMGESAFIPPSLPNPCPRVSLTRPAEDDAQVVRRHPHRFFEREAGFSRRRFHGLEVAHTPACVLRTQRAVESLIARRSVSAADAIRAVEIEDAVVWQRASRTRNE